MARLDLDLLKSKINTNKKQITSTAVSSKSIQIMKLPIHVNEFLFSLDSDNDNHY